MTASQSAQLVKGQVVIMTLMMGFMLLGIISMFYVSTTFGWVIGLIVGVVELVGIGVGFFAFYYIAVLVPVSQGFNVSATGWETAERAWGAWIINEHPLEEIHMDDEERFLPVRIPFGKYERKPSAPNNGEGKESEGLKIVEEFYVNCPNESCSNHKNKFRVDYAENYYKIPEITFPTYAYVMTPSNAPFKQAIIISPCKINSLTKIQDLMFFKGFPVMASTTFLSLSRIFEMGEGSVYGGPCYLVSFSSWHVEMAQRLAGFTPAFMVPTVEQIVHIYDMHGITKAMEMAGQITTLKSRVASLEANQPDFRKALQSGISHERKLEELIDMYPEEIGTKWLQPKYLALIAIGIISAAIITYLITIGFK